MTPYIHHYTVDIRSGMRVQRERQPVSSGDALADRFCVALMDGSKPVVLAGVGVSATVIRPDGLTVPIIGEVMDGAACVTLDGRCYDVSGDITITVTISSGDMRQSVLRVTMNVATSETGVIAETDTLNIAEILRIAQDALSAAERAEAAADRAEAAGGGGGSGGGIVTETDPTVPDWAKNPDPPTYTAQQVGADPAGTAAAAVSAHNADEDAHPYIQEVIVELADRLNALADSDDTTLDQLSEIVAYIKSNKSLIDSITTGKVSVSDIVNNLTSTATDKPLSAAQGVALKKLIDAIVVPTKTSQLDNDSGYLTEHQDISGLLPRTELDTAIDAALAEAKESGEFDGNDGKDGQDAALYLTESEYAALTAEEITAYYNAGIRLVFVEDDYENLVPKAISENGAIFNGCGYVSGKRLNSSGAIVDAQGAVVTGFIPHISGGTIRIEGGLNDNAVQSGQYVAAYDSNFAQLAVVSPATLLHYTGGKVEFTDENVCIYTIDTSAISLDAHRTAFANAAYIRVCLTPCIGRNLKVWYL